MKYIKHFEKFYDNARSKIKDFYDSKQNTHKKGIEISKDWLKSRTPEDMEIIGWYRDGGYRQIAEFLYNNNEKDEAVYPDGTIKSLKYSIGKLNNILESSDIKKDIIVYKGVRKEEFEKLIKSLNVGDTYTFQNFFSTSINFQYAIFSFALQSFSDENMLLKIKVKKGAKGAYISHDGIESEILLQRNQTIKLLRKYKYNLGRIDLRHDGMIINIYEFELISN